MIFLGELGQPRRYFIALAKGDFVGVAGHSQILHLHRRSQSPRGDLLAPNIAVGKRRGRGSLCERRGYGEHGQACSEGCQESSFHTWKRITNAPRIDVRYWVTVSLAGGLATVPTVTTTFWVPTGTSAGTT